MNKQVDLTFLSNYTIFATFLIIAIISIGAIIYSILKKRHERTQLKLKEALLTATTLNQCIRTLNEHQNNNDAINSLLKMINEYFEGDRAYIFEIDFSKGTTSNLYENVREGVIPEKDNLQDVPLESVQYWLDRFKENGSFMIDDVEQEVQKDTLTYELLKIQNISRLIAVPLSQNNHITGFLGVDNPKRCYQDLTLLLSVVFFIEDSIQKRNLIHQLEILSFEDKLTGVYNKNALIRYIDLLTDKDLKSLAIIYFDLNGLKELNDKQGHLAGDVILIDAASLINEEFPEKTFRFGGDEFIVLIRDESKEKILTSLNQLQDEFNKINISCSIGLSYREEQINIEEQLKHADQNMYKNKAKYYKMKSKDKNLK